MYSVGESFPLRDNPSDIYTIYEIIGNMIYLQDPDGNVIEVEQDFLPEVFIAS